MTIYSSIYVESFSQALNSSTQLQLTCTICKEAQARMIMSRIAVICGYSTIEQNETYRSWAYNFTTKIVNRYFGVSSRSQFSFGHSLQLIKEKDTNLLVTFSLLLGSTYLLRITGFIFKLEIFEFFRFIIKFWVLSNFNNFAFTHG